MEPSRRWRPAIAAGQAVQGLYEPADHPDPGEALGVYLTLRGFWVGGEPATQSPLVGYLPLLGLALVLFVRIWGTRDTAIAASTQWLGTGIAAIAFLLWVLGMGHSILWFPPVDGKMTSTLIVLFSFVVPYFYKGE